jgi:hypothetical protein
MRRKCLVGSLLRNTSSSSSASRCVRCRYRAINVSHTHTGRFLSEARTPVAEPSSTKGRGKPLTRMDRRALDVSDFFGAREGYRQVEVGNTKNALVFARNIEETMSRCCADGARIAALVHTWFRCDKLTFLHSRRLHLKFG